MTNFPYKEVYEYFAKPLDGMDISDGDLSPTMWMVLTDGTSVESVTSLPQDKVKEFYRSPETKRALGQFLRNSVAKMGDMPVCLVVICEAYFRELKGKNADKKIDEIYKNGSLADDPLAEECVFIQIYRPEGIRIGRLPISRSRIVGYAELDKFTSCSGRLTLNPDEEDLPNGAKFQ